MPAVDQVADAEELAHHRRLLELIVNQAHAADGRLAFDHFMELALYAPGLGYYVAGLPKLGAAGDFVTAPEISPLFGRCLAAQCAESLQALGGGDLLEFGAGSGALAAELLQGLARRQSLPGQYLILEPSPDLQHRQCERLRSQVPELYQRVHWLSALPEAFEGVMIANEVLDAMPVQRFCIGDHGEPLEVFVAPAPDQRALREVTGPPRSAGLREAVLALQARGLATDRGYRSEINPRLPAWMQALSGAMTRGLVLLIDYGYPRAEYYHPQRHDGALMGHYRHQPQVDVLQRLGLQDISAHVDFSAVAEAALAAGFTLAGYTTQAQFLIGCGLDQQMAALLADTDDPHERMQLSAGARQLVLPAAMGERFQVLGCARGLPGDCRGFAVRDLRDRLNSGVEMQ